MRGELRAGVVWLRRAVAAESRERRLAWIVTALILVAGPVVFNLSRASDFSSTVMIVPQQIGPLPPVRGTEYYQRQLADRELQAEMFKNVRARPAEYSRAGFRRAESAVAVTVRSDNRARAQLLATALGDQIGGATRRDAARLAEEGIRSITADLRTEKSRRDRLRLFRERRALVEVAEAPLPRGAPILPAAEPELTSWADRVADRLPGEFPGRASPFWAGLAGLVLLVTLWTAAFVFAPPAGAPELPRRVRRAPVRPRLDLFRGRPGGDGEPDAPAAGEAPPEPDAPPPDTPARAPSSLVLRVLWLAALATMPLITAWLISEHAVNVPFWDEWTLVPLFQAADDGSLAVGDFWAQANEHRPVFPRTADFLTALATGWDLRVEMYRNLVVAVGALVLVVLALRRTLDTVAYVVLAVVASVLLFSPVHWENWLWGWQLEWFLSNLAALGALWALCFEVARRPRRGVVIAAICGVVATFSLGQGLLIWPVGLLVVWLRRAPWRTWAALSAVVPLVYFLGWENTGPGSKTTFLERPGAFADYVTTYLGRSLANGDAIGNLVGAALLIAFLSCTAWVIRSRRDTVLVERASFWVGLGLYALGAALITAVARVAEGVAAQSRYAVMAALFAIATSALIVVLTRSVRIGARPVTPAVRHWVLAGLASFLLIGGIVNARAGEKAMDDHGDRLDAIAACTRQAETARDPCLRTARPSPYPENFAWITYLRGKGWAGYTRLPGE